MEKKFNDPSTTKNTAHVDFKNKNLHNFHSTQVNSFSTLEEQLTSKIYLDQVISQGVDDSSLLRLDPDEEIDEQNSIVLNSSLTLPKSIIKLPTKSYVDKKFSDPSTMRNTAHVTSMIKISITLD